MTKKSKTANDNYIYGSRIKEIRIQLGLTQNQVAAELEVTPGYISNVENGRTAMSLRMLIYFSQLSNLSLDSLVGRIEPSFEETAVDRDIMKEISKLSIEEKQKTLKTLKLWTK